MCATAGDASQKYYVSTSYGDGTRPVPADATGATTVADPEEMLAFSAVADAIDQPLNVMNEVSATTGEPVALEHRDVVDTTAPRSVPSVQKYTTADRPSPNAHDI